MYSRLPERKIDVGTAVAKRDDTVGLQPARELHNAWLCRCGRNDHIVKFHRPQLLHHLPASPEDADQTVLGATVLGFGVNEDTIKIGVAVQHRRVITIHHRTDPRLREALAQDANQRCGAHQIADVVTADDEDARRFIGYYGHYGYLRNR